MAKFRFSSYVLDLDTCQLLKYGTKVEIEPQVYCLLELLVNKHGDIVSRDEIIEAVWDGRIVSNNIIDNRLKSVRAAVGDNGHAQKIIKTYPNRGYRFIADVEELSPDVSLEELQGDSSIANPEDNMMTSSQLGKANRRIAWVPIFMTAAAGFIAFAAGALLNSNGQKQNTETSTQVRTDNRKDINFTSDVSGSTIAVFPLKVIGSSAERPFLPDIVEGELRGAIMAIQNISVVTIAPETQFSGIQESTRELASRLALDYIIFGSMTNFDDRVQLSVQLVRQTDNVVLWTDNYFLDPAKESELAKWPSDTAVSTTIDIANVLALPMNERSDYLTPYALRFSGKGRPCARTCRR